MQKNKEQNIPEINLLPQEGFSYTTAGRILNWVLSTFRYIVIFTELIVMTAFFSRFWLDAKNSDLSDEIKDYQERIASYSDFEKNFRSIQDRFQIYNKYFQSELDYSELFSNVSSRIPPEVTLESIGISIGGININGYTPNEMSILQFMVNIDNTNNFKSTSLSQIQLDEQTNLIRFSINSLLE